MHYLLFALHLSRGGVKDNSDLRHIIGDKSIGTSTITEKIGNSALTTTAICISGAVNELFHYPKNEVANQLSGCKLSCDGNHFYVENSNVKTEIGLCPIVLHTNCGNNSQQYIVKYRVIQTNGSSETLVLNDTSDSKYLKPSLAGYDFYGWFDSANVQLSKDNLANNKIFYAKWKVKTYTLYFNANGGSVGETSRTITFGSQYGNLPDPSRAGYTFTGWYTAPTGGNSVSKNYTMGASDATIYAQWKANSISLMDGNWSCSNNCLAGQSAYSITTSSLVAQTYGNYNASWYTNFSKSADLTNYSKLQMNISATLYNHGSVKVYVDNTLVYSAQYNNISNVTINYDISAWSGVHTILINFEQFNSGNSSGSTANSMTVTGVKLAN